jgi:hypothetical protein
VIRGMMLFLVAFLTLEVVGTLTVLPPDDKVQYFLAVVMSGAILALWLLTAMAWKKRL